MSGNPAFIGIGAQKTGTSWIHACLFEHPQIYMPGRKEVHFFNRHYHRGSDWYATHFRPCPPGRLSGEFSPTYLYSPEAPRRIRDWNPEVKLLVCLRNPVDRAVSAYRYALRTGSMSASRSFEEALRVKPSYVSHGLYAGQIERYLELFRRDQILITLQEDIRPDPYRFMERIYRFLDVDARFRPSLAESKVNESGGPPRVLALDRMATAAAATLRSVGLDRLVWAAARSGIANRFRALNQRRIEIPPLSPAQRMSLECRFAADARRVAELLGRDLSAVWFDYERVAG